jgi:hypothetical protein
VYRNRITRTCKGRLSLETRQVRKELKVPGVRAHQVTGGGPTTLRAGVDERLEVRADQQVSGGGPTTTASTPPGEDQHRDSEQSPSEHKSCDQASDTESLRVSTSPVIRPVILRAPVARTLAPSANNSVEEGSSQQQHRTGVEEAREVGSDQQEPTTPSEAESGKQDARYL